jgi:hypothetical protein
MQSLVDLYPLQINLKNSIRHVLYRGRCNVVHVNKSVFANDHSSIHLVAPTNTQVVHEGCLPIKEIICGRGFACN